jgi:hypothetical protein
MRYALIRVNEIPQNGAVTAELLGGEVLVMLLKGSREPSPMSACITEERSL